MTLGVLFCCSFRKGVNLIRIMFGSEALLMWYPQTNPGTNWIFNSKVVKDQMFC